jgi:cytochrome c
MIMSKISISIAALTLMAMGSLAHADAENLAVEKQCYACHGQIGHVGKAPGLMEIAERYRDMPDVEIRLARTIKNGGVGHWGTTPMPLAEGERPVVSEAEAKELVAWIFALH